MANKRMFTMKIVDSDAFLEMPLSTQCLYFHLNMRADDDGFVDKAKRIMRLIGASEDDLKILIAKRFVLEFESGLIVIKHWRMHNTLSKQRYHETTYIDEKRTLKIKENMSYSLDEGTPIDDTHLIEMFDGKSIELNHKTGRRTSGEQVENADLDLDIDLDIDKDLKEKEIYKEKEKATKAKTHLYGNYRHVKLTDEEAKRLVKEFGKTFTEEMITAVDEYCELHGKTYKNYNLAIRTFIRNRQKNGQDKSPSRYAPGKSGGGVYTVTQQAIEDSI